MFLLRFCTGTLDDTALNTQPAAEPDRQTVEGKMAENTGMMY